MIKSRNFFHFYLTIPLPMQLSHHKVKRTAFERCPFRRRYFFVFMGCNKKTIYNVLGGFYVIYYSICLQLSVHKIHKIQLFFLCILTSLFLTLYECYSNIALIFQITLQILPFQFFLSQAIILHSYPTHPCFLR